MSTDYKPSPYQVLRVANCSAGMVKSGTMLPAARASSAVITPSALPAPLTRLPFLGTKVVLVEAVYSMAWISQLSPVIPSVSPDSLKVKLGPETVDMATHVHLLSTYIKSFGIVIVTAVFVKVVRIKPEVSYPHIFLP